MEMFDVKTKVKMTEKPYWKVLKYCISYEYNKRYPLQVVVLCGDEPTSHFWLLPESQINSEQYDWTEAKLVDDIKEVI